MIDKRISLTSSTLKRRKRSVLTIKLALLAILIIAIFIALAWFSRLPQLSISSVLVEGTSLVKGDEVAATVMHYLEGDRFGFFSKKNVIIYPRNEIVGVLLKQYPAINRIKLEYAWNGILMVKVEERQPKGVWCNDDTKKFSAAKDCLYLDQNGFIYAPAPVFLGDVYVRFYGSASSTAPLGSMFTSQQEFKNTLALIANLKGINFSVSRVAVENTDRTIYLKDNSRITYRADQSVQFVFDTINLTLSENGYFDPKIHFLFDYIDLRFDGKVFYKRRTS